MAAKQTVLNLSIKFQSGTDKKTVYATWSNPKGIVNAQIKNFKVVWQYATENYQTKKKKWQKKIWFEGSSEEVSAGSKISSYSVPDNAIMVRVKVNAKSKKSKDMDTNPKTKKPYKTFTCSYKTAGKIVNDANSNTPDVPEAPVLTLMSTASGVQKLNVALTDINDSKFKYGRVRFTYTKPDGKVYYKYSDPAWIQITNVGGLIGNKLFYSETNGARGVTVTASVRASYDDKGNIASDFGSESSEVTTLPIEIAFDTSNNSDGLCNCRVLTETSVILKFTTIEKNSKGSDLVPPDGTTFEVEYTTDESYFDSNPDKVTSKTVDAHVTSQMEIPDLASGYTYVFRCRLTNSGGSSAWTTKDNYLKLVIGTKPSAPTTWSNVTTITDNGDLVLYWTHNSSDESAQERAALYIDINGEAFTVDYLDLMDSGITETKLSGESVYHYTWIKFSDVECSQNGTTYSLPTGSALTNYPTDKTKSIGIALGKTTQTKSSTITDYIWHPYSEISEGYSWPTADGRTYTVMYAQDYYGAVRSGTRDSRKFITFYVTKNNGAITGRYTWFMYSMKNASNFEVPKNLLTGDSTIKWKVRTRGVKSGDDYWSNWSSEREVKVYSTPELNLVVTQPSGSVDDTVTALPLSITTEHVPYTQKPLSYYIEIVANESYETDNVFGETIQISAGDSVYSERYTSSESDLDCTLGYNKLSLDDGVSYTLTVTASMDSGLIATSSIEFDTSFEDDEVFSQAALEPNSDTYTMEIKPYCTMETDDGISMPTNYTLSVYRITYNGEFVELATDIDNTGTTVVMDPHPSLTNAMYRIIATSTISGKHSATDIGPESFDVTSIILQWGGEAYARYEDDDDVEAGQMVTDTFIFLPYNIDVTENNKPEVELVNYIGRRDPVSYYGTHISTTGSWSTDIDATDSETISNLRKLSNYLGNVYVREPSGVGYWASVEVSWSIKHKDVVIPISINVTRVEGGPEGSTLSSTTAGEIEVTE